MAVVGTLGFNFQVILPVLARLTFDGDASDYTMLAIAMAIGALAGSLYTGSRGSVSGRFLITSVLTFGGFAAAVALRPQPGGDGGAPGAHGRRQRGLRRRNQRQPAALGRAARCAAG